MLLILKTILYVRVCVCVCIYIIVIVALVTSISLSIDVLPFPYTQRLNKKFTALHISMYRQFINRRNSFEK